MTYWKATVAKPDGAGGWTVVGVFGTDDSPVDGTGKYLHGETALDAAKLLLSHVWPIHLASFNQYVEDDRWVRQQQAKTGIADHRITVEVSDRPYSVPYGQTAPDPLTITVAELRLMEVRQKVAESVALAARAAELASKAEQARGDARQAKWRVEQAVEEAQRAGVDAAELVKAKRRPRQQSKKNPNTIPATPE